MIHVFMSKLGQQNQRLTSSSLTVSLILRRLTCCSVCFVQRLAICLYLTCDLQPTSNGCQSSQLSISSHHSLLASSDTGDNKNSCSCRTAGKMLTHSTQHSCVSAFTKPLAVIIQKKQRAKPLQ